MERLLILIPGVMAQTLLLSLIWQQEPIQLPLLTIAQQLLPVHILSLSPLPLLALPAVELMFPATAALTVRLQWWPAAALRLIPICGALEELLLLSAAGQPELILLLL